MKSDSTARMEDNRNKADFSVIIIGTESDRLITRAAGMFQRLDVDFVICRDIYEGIANLAQSPARSGLVVGRLEQLSREKGRLFDKAAQAGWECCCLAKRISGNTRTRAIQAMKSGAVVVNDPGQLEGLLIRMMRRDLWRTAAVTQKESDNLPTAEVDV